MENGVGVTWEYIFMGTGMKTGTGMGTGTYSRFTPSSTSAHRNVNQIRTVEKKQNPSRPVVAAALTCLQVLALHVGLAVGGLGQCERLAEHRLVLDVPHQTAARVRHGALVHQLNVHNQCDVKTGRKHVEAFAKVKLMNQAKFYTLVF